ncbi:PleD family two-component system response regulator [Paraburkholderia sabiae]|jgi:two-component system cell cycle response regulator|uniref:Response regulator n=1 Tax=Paraburkholderia sabiae TaxID=273251 RepID=A0ABU9Q939_9BURK|nr:response regulator [Paraburkholderia sabiae]WJZ78515.1 response regulator [Paraburkholderia sabiae]CAD6509443.1 Response regulator PleD [Paraburkholderia sabiae]CAG9206080.1 Response regulator [Paraburkholderia sabiae]
MSAYKFKLLIVDDDVATVRIMSDMLSDYGERRFALSGEMALLLARQSTPDLILLDASMPGMTGFDFCEILKADSELAKIPVIFVTSHDAPALEIDAFRLGASDYVTKPLNATQLRARVETQLRKRLKILDQSESFRAGSFLPPTLGALPDNILIIESDPVRLSRLQDLLHDLGRCVSAATGAQGLERALHSLPTVILVEAALPDANGMQLCAALKKEPRLEGVPVLLMTEGANSEATDYEHALLDGLADSVLNHAYPTVLKARVKNAIASVHADQKRMGAIREYWLAVEKAARRVERKDGEGTVPE